MDLKQQIQEKTKDAMRAKDKLVLGTLRMVGAAIKQIEVDERIELDDARITVILEKMIKQRKESTEQFIKGNRPELAEKEQAEIKIIQQFMPEPLSDEEVTAMITAAISETGAESIKDMGKVMGKIKPQVQGRADMGEIGKKIKGLLN
jgi:uncharacterized protein YqeY